MKFRLRDVFWLLFIVALACLLWRERTRTQKLAMQARFYHSAAPLIELIDEPAEKAITILEAKHGLKIAVDWPSIKEATGIDRTTPVTHNLVDGSLSWAIERIFFGRAVIEGTESGILIRGRDRIRDGPPKPSWETRRDRKAKPKDQSAREDFRARRLCGGRTSPARNILPSA